MKFPTSVRDLSIVYPVTIFASLLALLYFLSHRKYDIRTGTRELVPVYAPIPISFRPEIKALHINIGPNLNSILPPRDDASVAVLALEANLGIANYLRERHQKRSYPNRFFVINCAVSGPPLAGSFAPFHFYNGAGKSSSLSEARDEAVGRQNWTNRTAFDPSEKYGPGPSAVDFVSVLSLDSVLSAIPDNVSINLLKTDTQGHDLSIIRSASREHLRRVKHLITETYLNDASHVKYKGVNNDLVNWIPYMRDMGFKLMNPPLPEYFNEYDAKWMRID